MTNEDATNLAKEIERVSTLLEVMVKEEKEIKTQLQDLLALEKSIAEVRVRQDDHSDELKQVRARVIRLENGKEEVVSFIDKAKGALILIGFLQAALIGGATWIVSQVVDTRQDMAVLQYMVNKPENHFKIAPTELPFSGGAK